MNTKVLAIGVDAAESTLVRRMIEQDELPALRSLLGAGRWLEVQSPSTIGSGAVWPTFLTGAEPIEHGIYSEWKWLPETMNLRRYEGHHLTPFWKALAEQEVSLGVFDVPFAPPVGITRGFEVCEWWAHDSTATGLQAGPDRIRALVSEAPAHPLSASRFNATTPDSKSNLNELSAACSAGAELRGALVQRLLEETKPEIAVVVFPEVHHAGHQLWHTVASDHPFYAGIASNGGSPESALKDVYRSVDRQIGALAESVDGSATVMVFALHGMRPALGFPVFLGPLLCERGFSRLATWRSQTWSSRAVSLFAATKRHTPTPLKKLYYQLTPSTATYKLARPTMLPAYDWQQTRAFSLPTDQYGWIRINLIDRESQGIVPVEEYDKLCLDLEQMLLALESEDGEPLVHEIKRTAAGAASNPLPDLVVHWREAAFDPALKIKGSNVPAQLVSTKSTGQHKSPGFCIYRGNDDVRANAVVNAKDLGRVIMAGCGV